MINVETLQLSDRERTHAMTSWDDIYRHMSLFDEQDGLGLETSPSGNSTPEREKTRIMTDLNDVEYYLPLYDEEGIIDPEAHFHRTQLAKARDFGIPGVSDDAAVDILHIFPEFEGTTASSLTPEIREALTNLGKLIEQRNPEDWTTGEAVKAAITATRTIVSQQG